MYFLLYLGIGLLLNFEILAHEAGPNREGCHNTRNTNEYHCHHNLVAELNKTSSKQESITGIPKITDGDSIRIGRIRVRLHGIDAPEANQSCLKGPAEWHCGWEATNALANIIGRHWVTCTKRDVDRYGRMVAVCKAGPVNLNDWMVRNGWAVAYRRYSSEYTQAEETAKISGRGIWRGKFIMPWKWRESNQ
jgi:endonuclease YncB( thermonuclease family)